MAFWLEGGALSWRRIVVSCGNDTEAIALMLLAAWTRPLDEVPVTANATEAEAKVSR